MTTRTRAERVLFATSQTRKLTESVSLEAAAEIPQLDKLEDEQQLTESVSLEAGSENRNLKGIVPIGQCKEIGQLDQFKSNGETHQSPRPKTSTIVDKPERRRVCATYCPTCGGWVEVRLTPVRLHCTRCGLEARP